jgi:hypothetical protein
MRDPATRVAVADRSMTPSDDMSQFLDRVPGGVLLLGSSIAAGHERRAPHSSLSHNLRATAAQ